MVDTIKNVIKLGESIEYPDGYNSIDIEGSGDERKLDVFPRVILSGSTKMSSDGSSYLFQAFIDDPNSLNPFARYYDRYEKTTVSGDTRFQIKVGLWIHAVTKVFEYVSGTGPGSYDETYVIPIVKTEGRNLYIDPTYASPLHPDYPNWKGPAGPDVVVVYDGGKTLRLRDGAQKILQWWEVDAEESLDEDVESVAGTFLDTSDVALVDDEIPLPEITGQTQTLNFRYRPDIGRYGSAYLNGNYDSLSDTLVVPVEMGGLVDLGISLQAIPQTISPNGRSMIELHLTDYNGRPLNGEIPNMFIHAPDSFGGIGSATPTGVKEIDYYEETKAAVGNDDTDEGGLEIKVSYPVEEVIDIQLMPGASPVWTWNGNIAKLDGTSIWLEEGNEIPLDAVPIRVKYNWGGVSHAMYDAPSMDITEPPQTVHIGATVSGRDVFCSLVVDPNLVSPATLTIEPEKTTLTKEEEINVKLVLTDSDGEPYSDKKILLKLHGHDRGSAGKINSSVITVTENQVEVGSIQDRMTISVTYPVFDVNTVEHDSTEYPVHSWAGTTINLSEPLPVSSGDADVDYEAGGIANATYKAPNRDCYVAINAIYEQDDLLQTADLTIGSPGAPYTLEMSASDTSLTAPSKSRLTAVLQRGGTPQEGEKVTIAQISGPGILSNITGTGTNDTGEVESCFKAVSRGGLAIFTATYEISGEDDIVATVKITVTPKPPPADEVIETMEIILGYVSGWVDPVAREYLVSSEGVLSSWGEGDSIDDYGGTSNHPVAEGEPFSIFWQPSIHIRLLDLISVSVEGMTWIPDDFEKGGPGSDPTSAAFWILNGLELTKPFNYEYNMHETNIQITQRYGEKKPIAGVQVNVSGQQQISDSSGNVTFLNLVPGTHEIHIYNPNYRINRTETRDIMALPEDYPEDPNPYNKDFVVVPYSAWPYLLQRTEFEATIRAVVRRDSLYEDYAVGAAGSTDLRDLGLEADFVEPEDPDSDATDPCSGTEEEAP